MLNSWFSCRPSIISLFFLIGLGGNVQSFRSLTPVQAVPILDCAGIFEVADPEGLCFLEEADVGVIYLLCQCDVSIKIL